MVRIMAQKRQKQRAGIPRASSEAARKRMRAARAMHTGPEMILRSYLHRAGLRFRVQVPLIPGLRRRADIVFKSARVVVFCDGCFWHGCPSHGTWPKANAAFWRDKIETNRRRDADTNARLSEAGWLVVRVWEHETPVLAAQKVIDAVRGHRAPPSV